MIGVDGDGGGERVMSWKRWAEGTALEKTKWTDDSQGQRGLQGRMTGVDWQAMDRGRSGGWMYWQRGESKGSGDRGTLRVA